MGLVVGVAVALVLVLGACSGGEGRSACPADGCSVADVATLPYTAAPFLVADVMAPEQDGSWPVVVVAHGSYQRRSNVEAWARGIAAQGAFTYNVDWPEVGTGTQDSAEALACALQFAVSDAADRGADTSRVVVVGHSLGAAVGAAVSLGGASPSSDCAVADGGALPDAFVGYEGPYDESTVDYRLDGAPREPPGDESSNPHAQIGNNPDLVVRLLHGSAEDTQWYDVPMSTSASFADALQEAGYDVDVTVVEGANHTAIHNGTDVQQAIVDHVSDVLHDG